VSIGLGVFPRCLRRGELVHMKVDPNRGGAVALNADSSRVVIYAVNHQLQTENGGQGRLA
jgi:hypothetical protein